MSTAFVSRLDALADSIATVRVSGDVELSEEGERTRSSKDAADIGFALGGQPNFNVSTSSEQGDETRKMLREVRRGAERINLNFSQIARALRDIAEAISTKRVWLLLDEWSSVPLDVQPLLGEFLVRCVLPLQMFTVKIGAIEQQTNFRAEINGGIVGIELGADVAANVDLDELMVYEQNEERSSAFFRGLLFKHLTSGIDPSDAIDDLRTEDDLMRLGFTDKRAFEELVRAAEGVPRDAINIAAKAAFRSGTGKFPFQASELLPVRGSRPIRRRLFAVEQKRNNS